MAFLFSEQNEVNLVRRASALEWRSRLSVPHSVGWLDHHQHYATMQAAVHSLFAAEAFPPEYTDVELRYERDALGKPYLRWEGNIAAWAELRKREDRHLHVSNTHDGGAHIVVAAYHPDIVGIGIDAVYLPRLTRSEKDATYLRRFAARFMSEQERSAFEQASAADDLDRLRLRVAAHFSLMEAASKALGTGLKVGAGMGRETSLPKQSLGVLHLEPAVEMLAEGEAIARLAALGARRIEAHWSADESFLISVALLWKS